jgi:hypothetical protein
LAEAKRAYDFAAWISGDPSVGSALPLRYVAAAADAPRPREPSAGSDDDDAATAPARLRWAPVSSADSSNDSGSVVPVGYRTDEAKPPWWPLSPGDVFDPWREQFLKGMQGLQNFLSSRSRAGKKSKEECYEQYDEDAAICRARHSRACWAQAAERLANCLGGHQIPPLGFGGR